MTFRQWVTEWWARRRDARHIQPRELPMHQALHNKLEQEFGFDPRFYKKKDEESKSDPTGTEARPHSAEQLPKKPVDRVVHRFPEDAPKQELAPLTEPVIFDGSTHRDSKGRELWH